MANLNDPRIDALQPLIDRVRTDATARLLRNADGTKRADWDKLPLTRELLAQHLNGGPPRGVALVKPDTSVTRVAVFDLDSHKGEVPWCKMIEAAGRIVDALEIGWDCAPVVFRSGGGSGIHIYLLWLEDQDAYSVRRFCAAALAACGLRAGVGAVSTGAVEVFPKSDRVPAGKFGAQVFLPLYGRSELLEVEELSGMLASADVSRVAAGMWHVSPAVPFVERPARSVGSVSKTGDLTRLRSALDWLADCLELTGEEMGRNDWRDAIYGICEASGKSEEGIELAHAWSAAIPGYDEHQVDVLWLGCEVGKVGGVTGEGIAYRARALGWPDPARVLSTDTFDVVVVPAAPPGASPPPPPLPPFTRDRNGIILPTVNNAVLATRRPDVVGVRVGLDEFRDEIMVADEGAPLGEGWRPMRDADMVSVRMELETVGFKSAPKELARDAVVKVCEENRFDSAIVWLSGLEASWGELGQPGRGGCERFLIDYFGCPDTPYVRACSLYLWTALAGRVLDPGCQVDMALILAGDQGLRKSSAVAALVPDPQFFIEVDFGAKEDDTARAMRGALVGEIAELRGLHTRDREAIKKFMTRRHEKWTPKYKEFSTTFPRRIVFVGTVNPTTRGFLDDETGNRRWLPLRVNRADVEGIAGARDGLWAEAAELWRAGGVAWQAAEKLAPAAQEEFEMSDDWTGAIAGWLAGSDGLAGSDEGEGGQSAPRSASSFTVLEVAAGALGIAVRDVGVAVSMRVGAILRKLGFEKHNLRVDGVQTKVWMRSATPATEPLPVDG